MRGGGLWYLPGQLNVRVRYVAETNSMNFFVVKDGVLYTPPPRARRFHLPAVTGARLIVEWLGRVCVDVFQNDNLANEPSSLTASHSEWGF